MGEKRLIDANALQRAKYTHIVQFWNGKLLKSLPISEVPTVDAVEVVRCKDCTRYDADELCPLLSKRAYTLPDDFCSYGERRTDANL